MALVHDYLTQRGGAERVVLAMSAAYPKAPIYTSMYAPSGTFPEFQATDVRPSLIDRIPALRDHHRFALPLLAPAFSNMDIDATVTVCSSSGWAHGVHATGRKVVYCHNPARWLYQTGPYLEGLSSGAGGPLALLRRPLRSWDRRAALSADRYVVNSNVVRQRVADTYGIDAAVIHPPTVLGADGPFEEVPGIDSGFFLCVSRLLGYKNVDAVVAAFAELSDLRLVVVGTGPMAKRLSSEVTPNVTLTGRIDDSQLRWLYRHCRGLVAASYEDFGLTPVEAASFAKPSAVLRWGGFLDTTVEGETGVFFDRPEPAEIATAVRQVAHSEWDEGVLLRHASRFSAQEFAAKLRAIVEEESARA